MRSWRSKRVIFSDVSSGAAKLLVSGLLAGSLAQAGCENRQVAVFTVEGRPASASVLGVYSRINGGDWQADTVRSNLDQYGVEVPIDTSGLLETHAFAYQNDVPCSLGNGLGSLEMPGKYRQNGTFAMTPTPGRCVGATEPVDFPKQRQAVWASAANDIWIAGEGGRIVHWNGSVYTKIALPADLAASPPNWTSVVGRSPQDIWFAAGNNVVARYTNDVLQTVKINGASMPIPNWESIALGDPNFGDLWLAGSNGTFGYIASGASEGQYAPHFCRTTSTFTETMRNVTCLAAATSSAPGGYFYQCVFVGDNGRVVHYTNPNLTGGYNCENVPTGQTATLRGSYLNLRLATSSWDVVVVGDGGLVLSGLGSVALFPGTPVLAGAMMNLSANVPASARTGFNGIVGATANAVWLFGKGGVLVSWQDTAPMGSAPAPFVPVPTGITSDLTGGWALTSGFFGVGPGPGLIYNGEQFKP